MDFADAWDTLELGASVKVSNGKPPPSNPAGTPFRCWASHNFTGTLAEKIGGPYRAMRFDLLNNLGNKVGYTVPEDVVHTFTEG